MSGIANVIEILLVEDKQSKKPNAQGVLSTWKEARAVLRKEDGTVATVGRLRVPRDLEGQVTTGTFTCSFGLGVADYGDSKGDILPVITAITPVPHAALRRAAAPAPSAAS